MPDDFRISELPTSASFNNLDLMEISQVDENSLSGYTSVKKTMNQIGDKLNNSIEYAIDLNTTDKKIIGAINEVNGKLPTISTTTVGNMTLYKFGPIVCCVISGSWETDANGRLVYDNSTAIVPVAYRPSDAINAWETNTDTRLYVNTAGVVTIPAKVSQPNLAVRCSMSWFKNA